MKIVVVTRSYRSRVLFDNAEALSRDKIKTMKSLSLQHATLLLDTCGRKQHGWAVHSQLVMLRDPPGLVFRDALHGGFHSGCNRRGPCKALYFLLPGSSPTRQEPQAGEKEPNGGVLVGPCLGIGDHAEHTPYAEEPYRIDHRSNCGFHRCHAVFSIAIIRPGKPSQVVDN